MKNPAADPVPDRKIEPVYVVFEGAIMIEAPLKKTWAQMMNYTSWQNFDIRQHISGPADQEGEIVKLIKNEPGFSFPPYLARTVLITPEHRVIWKTYPETAQEVNYFGIVSFEVQEDNARTRVGYDVLYEFQVPYREEQELEVFRKAQYENFSNLIAPVFQKLKKLVEQR